MSSGTKNFKQSIKASKSYMNLGAAIEASGEAKPSVDLLLGQRFWVFTEDLLHQKLVICRQLGFPDEICQRGAEEGAIDPR